MYRTKSGSMAITAAIISASTTPSTTVLVSPSSLSTDARNIHKVNPPCLKRLVPRNGEAIAASVAQAFLPVHFSRAIRQQHRQECLCCQIPVSVARQFLFNWVNSRIKTTAFLNGRLLCAQGVEITPLRLQVFHQH